MRRPFILGLASLLLFTVEAIHAQDYHNLPIATAAKSQSRPQLVVTSGDGAYVLWRDERSNITMIYAQLLDGLLHPQWEESGIALTLATDRPVDFHAVDDGAGGFIIVWQDTRDDDGDIYAQRFNSYGLALWGQEGKLVCRQNRKQSLPIAISDGQRGAFVVWQDERDGNEDIYAQYLNPDGALKWEESVAIAKDRRDQTLGSACASLDGALLVAWSDGNYNLPRAIVQRIDAAGKLLWGEGVWAGRSAFSDETLPKLLVSSDSDAEAIHVSWIDKRLGREHIYAQRLDSKGALKWTDSGVAVTKTSSAKQELQLLAGPEGSLLLIWEDRRNDKGDVLAQRVDRAGKLLWPGDGAQIVVTGQAQNLPRAVSDGDGGIICAWQDERGSGDNIFAQRLSAEGQAVWEANGITVTNVRGDSHRPVLMVRSGGAFIAWEDSRRDENDIFGQGITAAGALENVLPLILSTPSERAVVDSLYQYDIVAIDYDSDATPKTELISAPAWLALQNNSLLGTPQVAHLGESMVELRVVDSGGAAVPQSYLLQVVRDASAPHIISSPDTVALEDNLYSYQIVIENQDAQGSLTFNLETTAAWLTISPSGMLSGTPLNEHVGAFTVTVIVANSRGKTDRQAFNLTARNTNDPPRLTTTNPPRAQVGLTYAFRFEALDVDLGDSLSFSATIKPKWLALSPNGAISGTPAYTDLSDTLLAITVTDREGASDQMSYSIPIDRTNQPPQFTSSPQLLAIEDSLYRYQVTASDPDPDDTLQFVLVQAPPWLSLSQGGLLSGRGKNEDVGQHSISVEVHDQHGGKATQPFAVQVQNVNDPPSFTSLPDTLAFVDSLYSYKPLASDIDRNDAVVISSVTLPSWLQWDGTLQMVRGVPQRSDTGAHQISLRVQDLAGATALQTFKLRVHDLSTPDTTAPGSPQRLAVAPAGWSANRKFVLSWQHPFDPNGIAAAYYKIGSSPTADRDGVRVALQEPGANGQIPVDVEIEGRIPVFLWLVDRRGNVDHKTAVAAICRHDHTPPSTPSVLLSAPSSRAGWISADSVVFSWQAATDANAGIHSYEFRLDAQLAVVLKSDSTRISFSNTLLETEHQWQVAARDSASNLGQATSATFRVDRTPPLLSHASTDTVILGEALELVVQASDARSGVEQVRCWFRPAGRSNYSYRNMVRTGNEFRSTLEAQLIPSAGLQYVISAMDSAGNVIYSSTNSSLFLSHSVVVRSASIDAPVNTIGQRYELISVPYRVAAPEVKAAFVDDFSEYNPALWRFFRFDAALGNVELDAQGFDSLEIGKGYWLITAESRPFDLDAASSVSMAQSYALVLQPGWNLIATPFDFPTDWSSVQKPTGVEAQLWGYDGEKYVGNNLYLEPWRGYFIRNLSAQPQTIFLEPKCYGCAEGSASFENDGTILPKPRQNENHDSMLSAEISWQLQIRVRSGDYADTENWLGISSLAEEQWDSLDLSEPPLPAGNYVMLRFDHRNWQKYPGDYTSDFRPPVAETMQWPLEIVARDANQTVHLEFHLGGELPEGWMLALNDEMAGSNWLLDFDNEGKSQSISLHTGKVEKKLTLWVGSADQLDDLGLGRESLPQRFELSPAYPNPISLANAGSAMSAVRFNLPVETTVELEIFDMLGRRIRSLIPNERLSPGSHQVTWDGHDDGGVIVSSGIYFYRLTTPQYVNSQKLVLLR